MGQEIGASRFDNHDYSRFSQRLKEETALLLDYFHKERFSYQGDCGGFEIEAWLINGNAAPAPMNDAFLKRLNSSLVVPELSSFNVELNSSPQYLNSAAFRNMHIELEHNLNLCRAKAAEMGIHIIMVGILPTVEESHLTLQNMSGMSRYRALNEEILKMREGDPLHVNISGRETLALNHYDVMLEAATTSFQIHMQIEPRMSARYYNAAIIASSPIVSACANSPFLFGKSLWEETRIPLFEQAVEVGREENRRVTFGSGYVNSMMECFEENLRAYPVLVPYNMEDELCQFSHIRFHNGMIWRWNRPLIGIGEDGAPHLRIEHRVVPAGPSELDSIANAALFYGYCTYLARRADAPEYDLDFQWARENFYLSAKLGLEADINWFNNRRISVRKLLLDEIIPAAMEGLSMIEIDGADIERYMGIIHDRVTSGQNGAFWQRMYVRENSADMNTMCLAYLQNQETGLPVHEWNY